MKIILGYISYYTIVFYSISLNDLLNYNDFKFGSRNSVFSITIGLIIVITIFDIEFSNILYLGDLSQYTVQCPVIFVGSSKPLTPPSKLGVGTNGYDQNWGIQSCQNSFTNSWKPQLLVYLLVIKYPVTENTSIKTAVLH